METGEFSLAEVDHVPVSGPLPAAVAIAASGRLGLLVQSRMEERHQVSTHGAILGGAPVPVA